MTRGGLFLLLVVGLATPVLATELGRVSATMAPGTWAKVTTVNAANVSDVFETYVANPGYDDSPAAWNSKKRRMYIQTATDHDLGGTLTKAYPLITFDDVTNTWTTNGPAPTTATSYHGYDNVAWDDANEVLYFARPFYGATEIYRYCVNNTPSWCSGSAGTWTTLPDRWATSGGCYQQAIGLAYHATMDGGSLLCYDGERGIVQFRESTGTWSTVLPNTLVSGTGPYHTCAEYSPIKRVTVFGCGGGTSIYKIDDNKVVTQLANAPNGLNLGVNSHTLLVDPVSGNFILVSGYAPSQGRLYELNPDGSGTWTLLDNDLTTAGKICESFADSSSGCSGDFYGVSNTTYGVLMFWKFLGTSIYSPPRGAEVWLYKHKEWITQPAVAWSTRSVAPGVLRAFGFDVAGDFATCGGGTQGCSGDDYGFYPRNGTSTYYGTQDSSTKAEGASALKFTVPTNSPADTSGSWHTNFSTDYQTQIAASGIFYLQWRQRFSTCLLFQGSAEPCTGGVRVYTDGEGWKLAIIGTGDKPGCTHSDTTLCYSSCTALTIVAQNQFHRGLPQMYNSCTGSASHGPYDAFEINEDGSIKLQNAIPSPYCFYPGSGSLGAPCFKFTADEWITFDVIVKTEARTTDEWPGSVVQLWATRAGQTAVKLLNWLPSPGHTTPVGYALSAGPSNEDQKFGKIWLLPYNTGKNSAETHPDAYIWYDSLIISLTPIAPPTLSAATPGIGSGRFRIRY